MYSAFDIAIFAAMVICALLIDLKAHTEDKPISIKSAFNWSIFWITLALGFFGYTYITHSPQDAQLFLAGYFLEKSLSVDNLFVMMAIFSGFAIEDKYQHRVLYYGILGALILRFIFIFAGTSLISIVGTPALIVFSLFIFYTAFMMFKNMLSGSEEAIEDYSDHWSVRFVKKFYPVYNKIENHDFFVKKNGIRMVTPLFLCLICIEVADIMFAFDSVPAIIAITEKPFLVYTSNIFAILGLRSLYFLLAAAKNYLCHLEKAVVAILVFIGIKLMATAVLGYHIAPMISLGVILSLLTIGIIASIISNKS